ncbi:hypothetical protein T484DRAFT_1810395 [Baffinella frigidus]|nr:hypothetical protein T484DRAFT_1810395 [Cryptophyta sp. CCMP2293]
MADNSSAAPTPATPDVIGASPSTNMASHPLAQQPSFLAAGPDSGRCLVYTDITLHRDRLACTHPPHLFQPLAPAHLPLPWPLRIRPALLSQRSNQRRHHQQRPQHHLNPTLSLPLLRRPARRAWRLPPPFLPLGRLPRVQRRRFPRSIPPRLPQPAALRRTQVHPPPRPRRNRARRRPRLLRARRFLALPRSPGHRPPQPQALASRAPWHSSSNARRRREWRQGGGRLSLRRGSRSGRVLLSPRGRQPVPYQQAAGLARLPRALFLPGFRVLLSLGRRGGFRVGLLARAPLGKLRPEEECPPRGR